MIYEMSFIENFSLNILRKYLDIENIQIELVKDCVLVKKNNKQIKVEADLNSIFDFIEKQRYLGVDVSDFMFKTLTESIINKFEKPRYRLIYSKNDKCWTTIAPHSIHNKIVKYYFGDKISIEG